MLAAALAGDVARVVLGVAMLTAGVAKIAQGRAWAAQAVANRIPVLVARGVPWLELATGAAVVSGAGSPWPTVVGIVLIVAFTAWIVAQLAAGRHPPCACFGALSATPLRWWHAARNVALIAIGVIAIAA